MAVTRDEVSNTVKRVAKKTLKIKDECAIVENAKFVDDLGADSLDQIDFIMEIEDEYGIEVPDEVIEKILTVGDAINHIMDELKKNKKN